MWKYFRIRLLNNAPYYFTLLWKMMPRAFIWTYHCLGAEQRLALWIQLKVNKETFMATPPLNLLLSSTWRYCFGGMPREHFLNSVVWFGNRILYGHFTHSASHFNHLLHIRENLFPSQGLFICNDVSCSSSCGSSVQGQGDQKKQLAVFCCRWWGVKSFLFF